MTKLDMLNKATYAIVKSYNLFSRIKHITQIKDRKLISKNNVLKNKGKEKCFIIGNGPSLKEIDLSRISDSDIFTVNFFHKNDNKLINFSNYHVMVDGSFYTGKYIDYLIDLYKKSTNTKFIFSTKGYDIIKEKSKWADYHPTSIPRGNVIKLSLNIL